MAVIIRLRRDGAKNSPYYRIVVADKHSPATGNFSSSSAPTTRRKRATIRPIKLERAAHWMKNGALPSDTVKSILKKAKREGRQG